MTTLITFATDTAATAGRGSPNVLSPGSDGNNWALQRGDQTPSFASNQLVFTFNVATNLGAWTYSTQSQADQEVLVNLTQNASNSDIAGAILRCPDNNHFYYADIGNSSGNVEIGYYNTGVFTQLAQAAFSSSFGTKYSLRFQVIGQTLKARIWAASTNEPSNWSVQATDNNLYTGSFGVCMAPVGASSCKFDTFSATNGFYVSPNPVPASVGAEFVGLAASGTNADLVPAMDIGAYKTWSLQIGAVASGATLTFQGSNDNSNWVTVYGYKAVDGTLVSTATATGIYYGPRNYRYLRVRQTAWTSGSTTGTLELYNE